MIDRPAPSAPSQGTFSRRFAVLLLAGAVALGVGPASAQTLDGPLQRSQVREYIRLRIELHQLQKQMEANADQYDDLPRAFQQRRAKRLRAEGWRPDAFNTLKKRITKAETALDMVADSAKRTARRRKELKRIESSSHLTDEQKAQLRKQRMRQDSLRRARRIEPTRRDWPAVRPYRDALTHLTDYIAGNRPDPPAVDDLPSPSQ